MSHLISLFLFCQRLSSQKLSEVLHHQAALLDRIVHEPRYYADYFRVAFYGDFPEAIRDKEFIVGVLKT